MKNFIKKISLFLFPIVIIQAFTWIFYTDQKGDLLRLGFVFNRYPKYMDFYYNKKSYESKVFYHNISEKPPKRTYKILTVGDSFSERGIFGYQNYLSKISNWDVLNFDRNLQISIDKNKNQIQILLNLLNSNFFDYYKIEYVILQSVERHFLDHIENIDTIKPINISHIDEAIKNNRGNIDETDRTKFKFPSKLFFTFPINTYNYFSKIDYCFENKVNKTILDKSLFSPNINELLFFFVDTSSVKKNNNFNKCSQLNQFLNKVSKKLNEKNIKLIVLPSPDKYDFYYENILNKKQYPKPLFFDNMNKLNKDYIYIDSKKTLRENLDKIKDIYLYDDTHWSPNGSKLIAEEIHRIISKN